MDDCQMQGNKLGTDALALICQHFHKVIDHSQILDMQPDSFRAILEYDQTRTREISIYRCMVKWMKNDARRRAIYATEFLKLIRLPLLEYKVIQSECTYVNNSDRIFYST